MTYEFECIICGCYFDVIQRMSDKHKAFHCGIEARRIWSAPATDKDLAYNFTTHQFGQSVVIYSKRQYKNLLKQHNLADASIKECRQQAEFKKRINAESVAFNRRKTAERIFSENKEKLRYGSKYRAR